MANVCYAFLDEDRVITPEDLPSFPGALELKASLAHLLARWHRQGDSSFKLYEKDDEKQRLRSSKDNQLLSSAIHGPPSPADEPECEGSC
ncbi:unnamed protein product [Protopolystoma xenopodis]|uniref:Uncharacterized protein n=1 Tax=Protopolystoma xenopodis TaxID=117903 RepID=A0A3S5CP64_9PLAT|nr:unnamed protein product [Protopolystoma xenopodis]